MKNETEVTIQLQKIVDNHGIEVIRDFVKLYNKEKRQQNKSVNNYKKIAIQVYHLVMYENYSKTRAQNKIADEYSISPNTVRNHCSKFDKEAEEFDYYSFGYLVEVNQMNGYYLGEANGINNTLTKIYNYKYKVDKKKKKNKKIDTSKFKYPKQQQQQQQQQWIPFEY